MQPPCSPALHHRTAHPFNPTRAHPQAFDFDAQALSCTLWAVAQLRGSSAVPGEWLETLLVAVYEKGMEGFGTQVRPLPSSGWDLGRSGCKCSSCTREVDWGRAWKALVHMTAPGN